MMRVRYWDLAATPDGGCYTVGVKMSRSSRDLYYVEDVVRGQWGPYQRNQVILQTAAMDGRETPIWIEEEGGSAGKEQSANLAILLTGYVIHFDSPTGDKITRSGAFSAQAEAGNVKLLAGLWNESFITELHNCDPDAGGLMDQVDASSGAFNKLALHRSFGISGGGAVEVVPALERNGQKIDAEVVIW